MPAQPASAGGNRKTPAALGKFMRCFHLGDPTPFLVSHHSLRFPACQVDILQMSQICFLEELQLNMIFQMTSAPPCGNKLPEVKNSLLTPTGRVLYQQAPHPLRGTSGAGFRVSVYCLVHLFAGLLSTAQAKASVPALAQLQAEGERECVERKNMAENVTIK